MAGELNECHLWQGKCQVSSDINIVVAMCHFIRKVSYKVSIAHVTLYGVKVSIYHCIALGIKCLFTDVKCHIVK